MKLFASLFAKLDQTNKTNAKVSHLIDYLNEAEDADKIWAIALFSGHKPRRAVKTSLLRAWASDLSGIPLWLLEESYHIVGDLAETLALILPPPHSPAQRSLASWMEFLVELGKMKDEGKELPLKQAWMELEANERFVFNKLITGGFRLGVSQKLLVRALARHCDIEENAVAHRLMGNWTPANMDFQTLLYSEDIQTDISKPYPFYLAYALEDTLESLGEPAEWQAEWKWDGIRSQLIKREGEHFIWSRGEELITDKFPEMKELAPFLPDGTVIDGELLPFKDNQPLNFQILQTRIGRKNVTPAILRKAPVIIMAYDLLEWDSQDIRLHTLSERRELLAKVVESAGIPSLLRLSPIAEFDTWEELSSLRNKAREHFSEGLMLKQKNSPYKVGRKRGDWWKWKVDPLSVDAVMIYAQRGHGRRANLYSDYTFAVWDGDALVPFTKAYSGLTDAEMKEVDSFVKRNTIERFGPVRSVKPQLVFEIGFEGIAKSNRHKSGVALRFPRMLKWRTDKKAEDADTLESLHKLLEIYQP